MTKNKSKTPRLNPEAKQAIILHLYEDAMMSMMVETTDHRIKQGWSEDFWQCDHEVETIVKVWGQTAVDVSLGLSERGQDEINALVISMAAEDVRYAHNYVKAAYGVRALQLSGKPMPDVEFHCSMTKCFCWLSPDVKYHVRGCECPDCPQTNHAVVETCPATDGEQHGMTCKACGLEE